MSASVVSCDFVSEVCDYASLVSCHRVQLKCLCAAITLLAKLVLVILALRMTRVYCHVDISGDVHQLSPASDVALLLL